MKKLLILNLMPLIFCTVLFAQTQKEIFDNGVTFFKQGQYQNAIDAFSKLIKIAPDHADAYKNRGVSYMKQKKYDPAIEDFLKAKELFPELKGLYSNLGVAYYYKKDYEQAIKSYDIELEMAPENYVAYFNRALCLAELGKNHNALDDLEKTLNLKPDFYWAICYKADLLAENGDDINAIKAYKLAIQQDSKNTYAKDKLAELNKKVKQRKNIEEQNENPEPQKESVKQIKKANKSSEDTNSQNLVLQNSGSQKPGYAIQTGAFLNHDNAVSLKTKLINLGFNSRVLILKDSQDKTWYIVRTGHYTDKNGAKKDFALLIEELGSKPVIRPIGAW